MSFNPPIRRTPALALGGLSLALFLAAVNPATADAASRYSYIGNTNSCNDEGTGCTKLALSLSGDFNTVRRFHINWYADCSRGRTDIRESLTVHNLAAHKYRTSDGGTNVEFKYYRRAAHTFGNGLETRRRFRFRGTVRVGRGGSGILNSERVIDHPDEEPYVCKTREVVRWSVAPRG